jgi:hypothetical protein
MGGFLTPEDDFQYVIQFDFLSFQNSVPGSQSLSILNHGLLRDSRKTDTRRDERSGGTKLVLERQDE